MPATRCARSGPGRRAEVAAVLRACAGHGATVVPQGGNTGLVGGSVPPGGRHGAAAAAWSCCPPGGCASLARWTRWPRRSPRAPGPRIADLRAHAAAAGLAYGVNLASRESATVGGTIATNAGGINTIRYGATRSQLLGIEAVLADGSIVSRLSGLAADNAGYDLAQLLAGSEGTLAVITAARLRLWPAEPAAVTLLAGVDGIAAAAALHAENPGPGPRAARRRVLRGGRRRTCPRADRAARPAEPPGPGLPARRDLGFRRRGRTAGGDAVAGRGGRRDGCGGPRRAVGLPRAPHRGDQHGGHPAQDGRGRAARPDRRVPRGTGPGGSGGGERQRRGGACSAGVRVRPHRCREPARERARPGFRPTAPWTRP